MLTLHTFWNEHENQWPSTGDVRRWTDKELDELQEQLNKIGLSQVSSAIGSIQLDKIDQEIKEIK